MKLLPDLENTPKEVGCLFVALFAAVGVVISGFLIGLAAVCDAIYSLLN